MPGSASSTAADTCRARTTWIPSPRWACARCASRCSGNRSRPRASAAPTGPGPTRASRAWSPEDRAHPRPAAPWIGPARDRPGRSRLPSKLARYAGAVARRYPGARDWTPVNEPLTTARFSGLYVTWAPHGTEPAVFWQVLRNECRGTVLAMRAIREVRPDARLVQTDDLGRTWSTPRLAYQAAFNNHLRWLSWDLLCGRVDEAHPLYDWLVGAGRATPAEIAWFADNPCPPDLVGVNYYVTSERYLDEALERYPPALHGGNGRDRYVDVEAARCSIRRPGAGFVAAGGMGALRDPDRDHRSAPGRPSRGTVALAGRDVAAACSALEAGVDLRALTLWALLGSHTGLPAHRVPRPLRMRRVRRARWQAASDRAGGDGALARQRPGAGASGAVHPRLVATSVPLLHASRCTDEPSHGAAPILITGATARWDRHSRASARRADSATGCCAGPTWTSPTRNRSSAPSTASSPGR